MTAMAICASTSPRRVRGRAVVRRQVRRFRAEGRLVLDSWSAGASPTTRPATRLTARPRPMMRPSSATSTGVAHPPAPAPQGPQPPSAEQQRPTPPSQPKTGYSSSLLESAAGCPTPRSDIFRRSARERRQRATLENAMSIVRGCGEQCRKRRLHATDVRSMTSYRRARLGRRRSAEPWSRSGGGTRSGCRGKPADTLRSGSRRPPARESGRQK